jgi:hypothetical protein
MEVWMGRKTAVSGFLFLVFFWQKLGALLINQHHYKVLPGYTPEQHQRKDYKHTAHYSELVYAPHH